MKQSSFKHRPLCSAEAIFFLFFCRKENSSLRGFQGLIFFINVLLYYIFFSYFLLINTSRSHLCRFFQTKPVTFSAAENFSGDQTQWARLIKLCGYPRLNDCVYKSRSIHIYKLLLRECSGLYISVTVNILWIPIVLIYGCSHSILVSIFDMNQAGSVPGRPGVSK